MGKAETALYALEIVTCVGIFLLTRRPVILDVLWSAVLIACAVLWLVANKPLEGRTLWVVTGTHGLTSGDLLAVPSVGIALALLARYRGSGRRRANSFGFGSRDRFRRY